MCPCETTLIKKNFKTHYARCHPGAEINWKSSIRKDGKFFFPDITPKQEDCANQKTSKEEIIHNNTILAERPRLNVSAEKPTIDYNRDNIPSTSADLQAVLLAINGKTINDSLFFIHT